MFKIKRILFFGIILIFQLKLIANTRIKGEFNSNSPLFMVQERDTILKKKYNEVKSYFDQKKYNKSLELGLVFLEEVKMKNKDDGLEFLGFSLVGDVFSKLNNHDKALLYYKKALNSLNMRSVVLTEEIKYFEKEFEKTNTRARILLKIGAKHQNLKNKDSAIYYYNSIIESENFEEINESLSLKAKVYSNLSALYREDSLYNKARVFAFKALSIQQKLNTKVAEASTFNNLANIYLEEGNYKKAKEYYFKGLNLLENDKSTKATNFKKSLYYNLAWNLYLMKDYKSYYYQEQSYLIKDSLRNAEFEHIVQGVFERHQIDIARKKVELTKAEEQKTAWFFGILSLLVIISSGVILYNYKLRQNNLKLKLSQTQFAQKSKLEKLKSESQVRILNATLDGKETERKQIAETLHDRVSSLLSSANLHLQATKMQFNGDSPIEIEKTQKIIVEASQTIRDLSHTLVSSVLLKFGLKYAIKDMAEKYSNSQMQINTDIKNLRRYHQNFEIKVNNIIQEFVNNTLKHSKASKAIVRIEDKNGTLIINIQDNGVGFDKKVIPEKDGLGINQIDARIQMMKGEFNIDSNSDNGTKIAIVLPILEKEIPIRV